jgi:hypothetical protein
MSSVCSAYRARQVFAMTLTFCLKVNWISPLCLSALEVKQENDAEIENWHKGKSAALSNHSFDY